MRWKNNDQILTSLTIGSYPCRCQATPRCGAAATPLPCRSDWAPTRLRWLTSFPPKRSSLPRQSPQIPNNRLVTFKKEWSVVEPPRYHLPLQRLKIEQAHRHSQSWSSLPAKKFPDAFNRRWMRKLRLVSLTRTSREYCTGLGPISLISEMICASLTDWLNRLQR